MLKSFEKGVSVTQKIVDLLISALCWFLAIWIRFYFVDQIPFDSNYYNLAGPLAFLTYYFFSKSGIYRSHRMSTLGRELAILLKANFLAVISFVVLLYFVNEAKLSRATIIIYLSLSTVTFFIFRFALRHTLRFLRRKGKNIRHVLLVGYGSMIESYVKSIQVYPDAGIEFVSWVDSRGAAKNLNIPSFAGELKDARTKFNPDSIFIGYPASDSHFLEELLKENYNDVTPLVVLPDVQYSFIGFQVEDYGGFPALLVNQPKFSSIDEVSKRIFDIFFSGLGLLFLTPFFFIIGLIIKIDSRGPVFFKQERVGLDGRKFRMWKFRSMIVNAEQNQNWTVKNDPRRTVVGTLLRTTSLDELPQLWNVFIGDMSLVGPRPEQPRFVEKFKTEIPAYMLRHKMKAGITGWAQVNGWRGDTSLEERIACDLYYVRNWSLWFDFKIIMLTFWRGFFNKNAY